LVKCWPSPPGDQAPESRAGTRYSYTDFNFDIACVVFEHAVGRPLFDEIERGDRR